VGPSSKPLVYALLVTMCRFQLVFVYTIYFVRVAVYL